jgi:Ribbon-Helix-Helix transcriptional regulator family
MNQQIKRHRAARSGCSKRLGSGAKFNGLTSHNHPYTICPTSTQMGNGTGMRDNVVPIRSKAADSEKITINLGYVDLGQIDLLVQEGF